MRFLYAFPIVFAAIVGISTDAFAYRDDGNESQKKELIGSLSVSDILIQPRFISTEDGTHNFDLDRSYFFFSWKMDRQLSAHFGVGRLDLINHNSRLATNVSNSADYKNFAFFEAYGEYESKYGTFKAGLIPLLFGWEGSHKESEWIFPRTLFYGGEDDTYANQNFGMRDYGVSYYVSYKDFYTQATVHNGENGKDLDGKIWHTAILGWKNKSGLEAGLSMSNGKYQNGNANPELDFSYGNLFFGFQFYDLFFLTEGYIAEQKTAYAVTPGDPLTKKFWEYHVDASHPVKKGISILGRYEMYDPDSNTEDDRIQRYILGAGFSNELRTSNLYVWFIKNKEQGVEINNDQVMVVWKVRSLSIF